MKVLREFKNDLKIIGVFLMVGLLYGCATLINGTKQQITINSNPSQAEIKIVESKTKSVVYQGTTPVVIKLQRGKEYDVIANLKGYKETSVHISKDFNFVTCGNLFIAGFYGLIIDVATGAMFKLEPNMINITLTTVSSKEGKKENYLVLRGLNSENKLIEAAIPLVELH